jgi:PAS domain S-box-containing protein
MPEERSRQDRWLALAVDQGPASILVTDRDGRIEYVNEKFSEVTGYSAEEALGRTTRILKSGNTPPEVYASLWEKIGTGEAWEGELQNRRKNGELYWDYVRISPIRDEEGRVEHFLSVQEDITERRKTEDALRRSLELFEQFAAHVKEAFLLMDVPDRRIVYMSPAFEDIWGIPVDDVYAAPGRWVEAVHPEDRSIVESSIAKNDAGESTTDSFRLVRPDGETRWVRSRLFPIADEAGRVKRIVGLAEDVTEERATEQALARSQRMEAVGRLAGGIAHDFNNLLTVILAEAQLMEADLPPGSASAESLGQIMDAANRAAVLTGQLVAFSRRQLIRPTAFGLNELVADMETMLRRIIGEDVRLVTNLSSDAGHVEADQGQVEQVIVNLIINSRDAMPGGGELSLTTTNEHLDEEYAKTREEVTPGEYVKLTVSDTGTGMTSDVASRAFDPFFTTKPPGKGSGLGLSTSYGIVKQSRGHIAVYSEPGIGTTVAVYLPRVHPRGEPDHEVIEPAEPGGGMETILVVEDEAAVRDVVLRTLRMRGYKVLEAMDGPEALELLEGYDDQVDLLLTDVVLPGIGGRHLAEQVVANRPGVKVLFMSGYTDDVILHHNLRSADYDLLQKPFTAITMATKVREVLDQPQGDDRRGETEGMRE